MEDGLNLQKLANNNISQRDVHGMTWPAQKNGKLPESFREYHFLSKISFKNASSPYCDICAVSVSWEWEVI